MLDLLQKYRLHASVVAIVLVVASLVGYSVADSTESAEMQAAEPGALMTPVVVPEGKAVATFAAGCFWCTEAVFQEEPGVESAVSGYAGGTTANPTYEDIYKQRTDHREALQVIFDPSIVSYERLLEILWQAIDPTDSGGQFVDRGFSYTAAIYYHDEAQQQEAVVSKQALADSGRFDGDLVTPILPFSTFYEAENYHQDFYLNSAERYQNYASNSGREEYKAAVWAEIMSEQ